MANAGVRFEGVWKKFRRGAIHDSLRDLVPALARRVVGRGRPAEELRAGDFWAVRDVSFEVREGDTLGIIGGNGAGKSTVLKILTGILRPTRGLYHVDGRVGALIEISAGFHPDLTGRENVSLQGAIRGMPKAVIRRQFDSIVEFSGIEEFIDTPVKRYSSGMNARLGFAIAAHLDPEVLIIDEVLAVGDLGFQTKAFNRIREMATSGIPVVIVSHQLDQITELCTKAILLDHGAMVCLGTPEECIARYTQGVHAAPDSRATGPFRIHTVRAVTELPTRTGEDLGVCIEGVREPGATAEDGDSVRIKVVHSQLGHLVFETTTSRLGIRLPDQGPFQVTARLQMNLQPNVYRLETAVYSEPLAKVVTKGPNLHVQVASGFRFDGPTQLNPRLTVEPGP